MRSRLVGICFPRAAVLGALLCTALVSCSRSLPLPAPTLSSPQVQVRLIADEADEAIRILELRTSGAAIPEEAWVRLFATEGYRNLRTRELGMHRPFTDSAFKAFLLSDTLLQRLPELRRALADYRTIDAGASAARALRYLPDGASIHARMYLEIKPRTNSFVYPVPEGRGIFIYVDPRDSRARVERDIVTHELHHIGFAQSCGEDATAPTGPRATARAYAGALGEGIAMLAAAGGSDVDPHAASSAAVRTRWTTDYARWPEDLRTVERFLLDVAEGRLTDSDSMAAVAAPFWGDAQGAWYTVGYAIGSTIERAQGRDALRRVICNPATLLATYNAVAVRTGMPIWNSRLIELLAP